MRETPGRIARALHEALAPAPVARRREIIRAFLMRLIRERRVQERHRIEAAFERIARAAEGTEIASVVTARELDAGLRRRAKEAFPTAAFTERTDTALIGGTVVRVGETLVDGSVRGRLDRLGAALRGD